MADLASVEQSLVSAITQVVYPHGTAQPSLTGAPVIVYRGWPIPRNLDKDLASGTVNISVFAQDNERKVTRFPREWQVLTQPTVGLTLTISNNTLAVGGAVSSPLNAAASVNGNVYIYAVQPSDTPTTIATALAALIDVDTQATSSGPVITIPGASNLSAVVGGVGAMIRETKRQARGLIVTLWCPDPDTRDALAGPLDAALADVDYLTLPDGSGARLVYEKTRVSDRSERDNLYRRDLFYSVEYATTDAQPAAQIVDVVLNLGDFAGNSFADHDALLLEGGGYMLMEDGTRLRLDRSLPAIELESGGYLLMEDGGRLSIDDAPPVNHADSVLLEGGAYLLTEGGFRLDLDATPILTAAIAEGGILLETGGYLLLETGYKLLLEA